MCGLFGFHRSIGIKTQLRLFELNYRRGAKRLGAITHSRNALTYTEGTSIFFPDDLVVRLMQPGGDYALCHWQQPTGEDYFEPHPFRCGDWLVAHNGVIHNFDTIANEIGLKEWPWATDSSIIPAVLNHFHALAGLKETNWKVLNLLEGIFACWTFNIKTQEAYLFRWASPLFIDINFTYFSSVRLEETDIDLQEGVVVRWPQNAHHEPIVVGTFEPEYHPYK